MKPLINQHDSPTSGGMSFVSIRGGKSLVSSSSGMPLVSRGGILLALTKVGRPSNPLPVKYKNNHKY